MAASPVELGSCAACGAIVYLGQQWCQRCFAPINPAMLVPKAISPTEQPAADARTCAHDADGSPSMTEGIETDDLSVGEDGDDDTPPEADTAAWKSVNLVSEAWDLAEGHDESASYPMTRMEIRRAVRERNKSRRKRKRFRRFMLSITALVVFAGIGGGAYLAWQRFGMLTPARYASEVKPVIVDTNHTISSVRTLVQQVSLSEVPDAYQSLEAHKARNSFESCVQRMRAIAAPSSRSTARRNLIAACRDYDAAMSEIDRGGSSPLVDVGVLHAHVVAGDRAWQAGTSAVGSTSVTLDTGPA